MTIIHGLSQILHFNPNTQEKVNYFADFFKLYNRLLGFDHNFAFENPLSLIKRINYQIENNEKKMQNYLPRLLDALNTLDGPYRNIEYQTFKAKIGDYLSYYKKDDYLNYEGKPNCLKNGKDWIEENKDVLKNIEIDLNANLLYKSVYELINLLQCSHILAEHKSRIEYLTKIIVSEFRFNEESKGTVNRLIPNLMSKSPADFPLPKHTENIGVFFRNRTFQQQFEGILNFATRDSSNDTFVYRIFNLEGKFKGSFIYNKVTFTSSSNNKIQKLVANVKRVDNHNRINSFFEVENCLYGYIHLEYLYKETAKKKAKEQIQDGLNYINKTQKFSGYLDEHNYITTSKDFSNCGWGMQFMLSSNGIDSDNIKALKGSNPYEILKSNKSIAAVQFLAFEPFFLRYYISGEISDAWNYLETLLGEGEKNVIDNGKKVLIKDKLRLNLYDLRLEAFNSLNDWRSGYQEPGISFTKLEAESIWKDIKLIDNTLKRFTNPFVSELQGLIENFKKAEYKTRLKEYYINILNETYEVRNAFIHQGIRKTEQEVKLKLILPNLIDSIRETILKEIKRKRTVNLEDLIKSL